MKKKKSKKSFFAEFRAFISKGNIIDLAVAVVIGGAFGKIVTSLVNNILMPLLSLAVGGINFADLKWVIKGAEYDASDILIKSETALGYGLFIQATIDFIIIAFCIFVLIKLLVASQNIINDRLLSKAEEEEEKTEEKKETVEELLAQIRDLLNSRNDKEENKEKEIS